MLAVLQRVTEASVVVNSKTIGEIAQGLLILCGFEVQDTEKTLENMIEKCLKYRIFDDPQGKMNLSLKDIQGGLLLVPQFTLVADTQKGLRPSFSRGASPPLGRNLFDKLLKIATTKYYKVSAGEFGAAMKVHLCNDGPVTFILNF